jgi:hypothetical protein
MPAGRGTGASGKGVVTPGRRSRVERHSLQPAAKTRPSRCCYLPCLAPPPPIARLHPSAALPVLLRPHQIGPAYLGGNAIHQPPYRPCAWARPGAGRGLGGRVASTPGPAASGTRRAGPARPSRLCAHGAAAARPAASSPARAATGTAACPVVSAARPAGAVLLQGLDARASSSADDAVQRAALLTPPRSAHPPRSALPADISAQATGPLLGVRVLSW